jgi:hypothetical protein
MRKRYGTQVEYRLADRDAEGQRVFSWKPAVLRTAITWRLSGTPLTGTTLTGHNCTVDLADVTSAGWVDYVAKGFRMTRLDLYSGRDRRASISITSSVSTMAEDPDLIAFGNCVAAICHDLAQRNPDLPVTIGERGWASVAIFAVGAVSVLGGIGLLIVSLAGLGGARGLESTAVPILTLILFGVLIASTNLPWRRRPQVPISEL